MVDAELIRSIVELGETPATIFALAVLVRAIGYAAGEILRARAALRLSGAKSTSTLPAEGAGGA